MIMKNTLLILLTLLLAGASFAQNWNILDLPSSTRYDDVFFLDETTGWTINSSQYTVYKTTDGGDTWTSQFESNQEYLRNISFLDEDRGFLGTLSPSFYKTINGGQTWALVSIPGVEAICGLDVVGNNTVYGCGAYFQPAYLIKSSDGGDTWTFKDMSAYASSLVEVLFLDENIGFASGGNEEGGIIIKTIDGGDSWIEIFNTEVPGEIVWKMQQLFSNPDAIFGSVQAINPTPGKLVKSLDGGENWSTYDIIPPNVGTVDYSIQGVGFITEDHGWVSGHHTSLLETLDGGLTWAAIENYSISSVNRFHVLNESFVFASGVEVYKFNNSLSVKHLESKNIQGLKIKASPNPVKDQLNISILFERNDHMVITLFDEQGRKIKQLSRETITEAGEKLYSFDFPYPSGIYFIHFHSDVDARSIKIVKR